MPSRPFLRRIARSLTLVSAMGLVAACGGGGDPTRLALEAARPKNAPVRNLTSFSEPLLCMDRLLARAGRRTTTLSSSDIPDLTRSRPVGADDMLINAISQMNRSSRSYVFIDPTRVRGTNVNSLVAESVKYDNPKPQYYIRGSISQIDRDVHRRDMEIGISPAPLSEDILGAVGFSRGRGLSVVSVDLHLIEYTTRQVLPGASVANSMVVVGKSWEAGAAGLIDLRPFNLTLEVARVESESQAVRNLVELGVIELLGRHAGVPYHTCLSAGMTAPRAAPSIGPAVPVPTSGSRRPHVLPIPSTPLEAARKAATDDDDDTSAARNPLPLPPKVPRPQAKAPLTQSSTRSAPVRAAPQPVPAQAVPPQNRLRALQTGLVLTGYLSTTTGRYDAATRDAVARFQAAEGLIASGVANPETEARLRHRLAARSGG